MILNNTKSVKTKFDFVSPMFEVQSSDTPTNINAEICKSFDIKESMGLCSKSSFVSTVKDNSMNKEQIYIGDTLIFKNNIEIKDGQMVALSVEDDLKLSKYNPDRHLKDNIVGVLSHIIRDVKK
ncbi:MAG: hypothetical protein B7C24_17750 [Bacteroidetes bacterium 4572_77]|nr:MAG: hypothetical protein B7C24_17750 [Bacteroidetes bacterium 4572_77]